jgi:hypothetical protein
MKTAITRRLVRLHDRKLQRDLHKDESGLTMLAYALGAAVVIAPLAAVLFGFGNDTVTDSKDIIDSAIDAP